MLVKFACVHRQSLIWLTLAGVLLGTIGIPYALNAAPNPAVTVLPDGSYKFTADDAGSMEQLGYAMAVDGNTAVISAISEDSVYVFVHNGNVWVEQAKLTASGEDHFGESVDIDGDTIIVGDYSNTDEVLNSGAAYVFTRTNGTWSQQQKLTADDAAYRDFFGESVAVDGDTALIGAYGDDNAGPDSGAAYVFTRTNGTWSQQQKLLSEDIVNADQFGRAVALDGNTAVITAVGEDEGGTGTGSAYVFTRINGTWVQSAKVFADDGTYGSWFGRSVALDSGTAIIGAYRHEDDGTVLGAAYIFADVGGGWAQQAKLTASDAAEYDFFGWSVAVDDNVAVVGSYFADDDERGEIGAAYVFARNGNAWWQYNKLTAHDAASDDQFGWSVAVVDNMAMIGSRWDDAAGYKSGAVYVYDVTPPDPRLDVNRDNIVSPSDAAYIINRIGDPQLDHNADVDNSGTVDETDLQLVIDALGITVGP